MTIPKRIGTIFIFAALGSISGLACAAGSASAPLIVNATVVSQCLILNPTIMDFGVYNPTDANDSLATSTIKVKCTKNRGVTIGLDGGTSADDANRVMTLSGNDPLPYYLYYDSNRTANWGANSARPATGQGLNTEVSLTVYGKIPAHQYTAGEGLYSDTVIATVNF